MNYTNNGLVYDILYRSIIAISVMILLMLVLLVCTNIYNIRREKKKAKLTEKYIDWISNYVTDDPITIRKFKTNLEFEAFTEVCNNTLIDIRGEYAQRVTELTYLLGVTDYYKKMAQSNSWPKRYMAIEKLGFLKDNNLKEFYYEFMNNNKSNNQICLKTLVAYSFISDRDTLYILTNKLTDILKEENILSAKIIEHIYNNAFKVMKENNKIDDIRDFLKDIKNSEHIPSIVVKDIINSCGNQKLEEVNDIIIDYYHTSDDIEIKSAAIKALGKIALAESNSTILKALTDQSWIVRLVAAKASVICGYDALELLKPLLNDKHYYVRFNAAKTLAVLGEKGIKILKEHENSKNSYVSNTVKYVLDLNLNHVLYG